MDSRRSGGKERLNLAKSKPNTVHIVSQLVQPIAQEAGVRIWDVRFEKEGSLWFLRVFLDKDGGVNISDCETVSRALSTKLDETDPIEQSYVLEVSSPGVERDLIKPEHFQQFIGSPIQLRLIRPVEGVRDFVGQLVRFTEPSTIAIQLDDDVEMEFQKSETAYIRLVDNYEPDGEPVQEL